MIDAAEFYRLRDAVSEAGYGHDLEWSEGIMPPTDPDEFAREAIFVICNSGMRFTVAQGIFERVMGAIGRGESPASAFGHKGKSRGIAWIWENRVRLFAEYLAAADKLAFCASLPWIGNITKYHLAKNFGADVAKPDRHLQRLADAEGCTAQELCDRLAAATGYRAATVDVVLWRACALGITHPHATRPREVMDMTANPEWTDPASWEPQQSQNLKERLADMLTDALAEDDDHMVAESRTDLAWLMAQLACWPTRVDPDKTTNMSFLMKSAAATLSWMNELLDRKQEAQDMSFNQAMSNGEAAINLRAERDSLLSTIEADKARIGRLEEGLAKINGFVTQYFEPWGSWKTAWWEGEVSDDAAFSDGNALKHVANLAARALLSDEMGEGR